MSTEERFCIDIVEATLPEAHLRFGAVRGYGRDAREARCHAGWGALHDEYESFGIVTVSDLPDDDGLSERICHEICDFHIKEATELPKELRDDLQILIAREMYASAVSHCFYWVWDMSYEEFCYNH
ncbi:hypothetical protein MD588_24925 [Photobacterium sp. SDRW27]|uniref:hypothetical protein n=1 Tax=Photobacterium obscurum TaxID=2829490 RepID=UPI002243C1AA|nr:hypothetical protein [Photobacterium obscurum]MCW8332040.1 hypothetical protein [Photobacterium obscurum]